ncbi:MAG TPA: CBS and ACT domain-containing protein [Trueperaceae bacterium]|nr:CBS and ACT domain-containing protein [Trueperaceae bacterium]
MLVSDVMTRQVVAIGPDTPIRDVQALMEQRNIRHFPILESRAAPGQPDALVGIVSDRDVRLVGADHPRAPKGVRAADAVSKLMVRQVVTAHPGDPIEETAKTMRTRKIGAMPVMDEGRLVGIVTATDLLDALVTMSGVRQAASRLEVEVPNRPGALAELLGLVADRRVNVVSVLTTRGDDETVTFVLRVATADGHGLARYLREAGVNVSWPPDKRAGP